MKRSPILFLTIIALLIFNACKNDDDLNFTIQPDPEGIGFLNTFLDQYTLAEIVKDNVAERFTWNPIEFTGTATAVTYELQESTSTEFTDYIIAGSTSSIELPVTIGQFLDFAEEAGLDNDPDTEEAPNTGQIYFRVRAYSGEGTSNSIENISEVKALTVFLPEPTGEEEPVIPLIAVPGNHQGWDPPTAPLLAASSATTTDYEGFVWLDGEFKFIAPDGDGAFNWGNLDWGDASGVNGSYTEVLIADGEGNIGTDAAEGSGYYLVNADTDALTYSLTLTNWSVTGNATPLSWPAGPDGTAGQDHDMTYDPGTKTWSVTLDLTQQDAPDNGIKFRANDAWTINIGDNDADGTMEFGGQNMGVPEDGNYTIILDLSNPRAYTYSLIKN
jgi:hypothetical protein